MVHYFLFEKYFSTSEPHSTLLQVIGNLQAVQFRWRKFFFKESASTRIRQGSLNLRIKRRWPLDHWDQLPGTSLLRPVNNSIIFSLDRVEQKLGSTGADATGGCYNITEVQAIMAELREIQKSLSSGEKERSELMQSLAKLKDELTRLELCADSVSSLNLQSPLTLSTASQTDLCAEVCWNISVYSLGTVLTKRNRHI